MSRTDFRPLPPPPPPAVTGPEPVTLRSTPQSGQEPREVAGVAEWGQAWEARKPGPSTEWSGRGPPPRPTPSPVASTGLPGRERMEVCGVASVSGRPCISWLHLNICSKCSQYFSSHREASLCGRSGVPAPFRVAGAAAPARANLALTSR